MSSDQIKVLSNLEFNRSKGNRNANWMSSLSYILTIWSWTHFVTRYKPDNYYVVMKFTNLNLKNINTNMNEPPNFLFWEVRMACLRAITSVDVKLCKTMQNGKRCSFYTIWAKKPPTSARANLCINASCYNTRANMHGYCSMCI